LPKKWTILILILIVIPLAALACSSPKTTPTPPPDSDKDSQGAPCEGIKPVVEAWIDDNLDEVGEKVGELVTLDLPIARDIVAAAVESALQSYLKREIVEAEPSQDKQTCIARVRLIFPLRIDLPLISQEHQVQVDYELHIRENRVVDSDFDLDSFQME
jgi:hypothetical protein